MKDMTILRRGFQQSFVVLYGCRDKQIVLAVLDTLILPCNKQALHPLVAYDRTVGYSLTEPTEAFKKTLEDNGFVLEVPFARVAPKPKAKAEREKAHKYVCPICGQEVKTTADLSLICGVCEVRMERAD